MGEFPAVCASRVMGRETVRASRPPRIRAMTRATPMIIRVLRTTRVTAM
jgi:hypothetical protein